WIDDQTEKLKDSGSKEELALMDQINNAYDAYRTNAYTLTNISISANPGGKTEEIDRIQLESKALLGLGNQLVKAHRQVVETHMSSTQSSLTVLQQVIFALLVLLLALGAWLAVVVYREMIAPLRVKLVESQTIIERQEKLASLGVLAAGLAHEIRNPLTAIKARLFTQQKVLLPDSREHQDAVVIGNEI